MAGLITCRDIVDGARLAELEAAWWDLWHRCPAATPFQSPAWLIPWWRAFAPGFLRVSAAFDGDRLIGLFPFYIEIGSYGRRLLPLGISVSDYLDVLIDPDWPCALQNLAGHIGRQAEWDWWSLEELPPGAIARSIECPPHCAEETAQASACPVLYLSGNTNLEGCVPAQRRRQLRRARAAAAPSAPEVIRVDRDLDDFFDTLFALHAARWSERGETGVLCDQRVQDFHREALKALARRELTQCYVMTVDGRPVAAYYGLFDRGRAFAYLGGFDPAYREISPGAILIGHAIEDAIRQEGREFHFLRGREAYKYRWGACDVWNQRRSFRCRIRHRP